MNDPKPNNPPSLRPLRVWPAITLVLAIPILRAAPQLIKDGPPNLWMAAAFGPLLCSLLILLWWLLASRASSKERIVGLLGIVLAAAVTGFTMHRSMLGPAMTVITVPMGLVAFAMGAILLRNHLTFRRTRMALLLAAVGFSYSQLLRNEGMWGDFKPELLWRWNASPEEQLLAEKMEEPDQATRSVDLRATIAAADLTVAPWPAFRGADRSGRVTGVEVEPWTAPPKQLWKTRVGPAWSSFAIAGAFLFTQEQRGENELVVCYSANSGEEVWNHSVVSRFEDSLGGPGPRATPTVAEEALFAMGAEGWLMRLGTRNGELVWQQDLREVANCKPPQWGFASSPLVVKGNVIVHAGGGSDQGILAFDVESGELAWSAETGQHSYSSPQLCSVEGEELVIILTNAGMTVLDPETGDERLDYEWKINEYRALQPAVVDSDSVLIPSGTGNGTRRVKFLQTEDGLDAEEIWTSRHMKPDFNDLVVHNGYGYGFDGEIFSCIDLETGKRTWKGGRYGKGQVVLIADSEQLLVASEYGDVVLLKADPAALVELAKFKALDGKTWNHPVVVGNRLYIRNAQQAACYELVSR